MASGGDLRFTGSEHEESSSSSTERIAGAVANAVRQSLSSALSSPASQSAPANQNVATTSQGRPMCSFPVCLIVERLIQTPFQYFQVEDKLFSAVLLLRAKQLLKKESCHLLLSRKVAWCHGRHPTKSPIMSVILFVCQEVG